VVQPPGLDHSVHDAAPPSKSPLATRFSCALTIGGKPTSRAVKTTRTARFMKASSDEKEF